MEILDLHGQKHENVDEIVRSFLNFIELPCQIITGNSQQMKSIVKKVVEEYEWFTYEKDSFNHGTLIIVENTLTNLNKTDII
jgi:DNA-nicking Smr family endonuclease